MITCTLLGLAFIGVIIVLTYFLAAFTAGSFKEAWHTIKSAWIPTIVIWLVGGVLLGAIFTYSFTKVTDEVTFIFCQNNGIS